MAIPAINVLGNPNVTEGNFQIAIEDLRKSVIGSGKAYDSANTYSQYDTCVSGGIVYYSKINSNTGNTPAVGTNWGLIGDLITGVVHNVGNESIGGIKTFTSSPIVPIPTLANQAISMGNILEKTAVGIGYGTGSGGTVTQYTSKTTNVTLNKPTGKIIMNNSALPANSTVSFTVYNTAVNYGDTVSWSMVGGLTLISNYEISIFTREDSMDISITNKGSTSLSEPVEIMYSIIRGAMA